jgi:hypothetical protein
MRATAQFPPRRARGGFGLLESLVMLGVLLVFTMVVIAVARKMEMKWLLEPDPAHQAGDGAPASGMGGAGGVEGEQTTEP